MNDQAHRHGTNIGLAPHGLRVRNLITILRLGDVGRNGFFGHPAAAAIDDVDAMRLELTRKRHGFGQRPARLVDGRGSKEQRLARGPRLPYALDHLNGQAHAVLERTSVLIRPEVAGVGQELVDQVAVRAMNLQHVEACAVRTIGRASPEFDLLLNIRKRHFAGHAGPGAMRLCAWRNEFPLLAVIDALLRGIQRGTALPGDRVARLAARMTQLDADRGAEGLHETGDALQGRDEVVLPQPGIPRRRAAARINLGGLHEHQSDAADRELAQMDEMEVVDATVVGAVSQHRRQRDPVLDRDVADLNR